MSELKERIQQQEEWLEEQAKYLEDLRNHIRDFAMTAFSELEQDFGAGFEETKGAKAVKALLPPSLRNQETCEAFKEGSEKYAPNQIDRGVAPVQ